MIGPEIFTTPGFSFLIFLVTIWDVVWKGVALWKSSKNNQLVWFVFILILNTVGILPIIYIVFFQKKTAVKTKRKVKRKKKK